MNLGQVGSNFQLQPSHNPTSPNAKAHGRVTAAVHHGIFSPMGMHSNTIKRQSTVHWGNTGTSSGNEGEGNEGLEMLARVQAEMDDTLQDLDKKLHRVLAKQEYDYMKCYTLFVKKKERELKELIMGLSEKAKDSGRDKDERIR